MKTIIPCLQTNRLRLRPWRDDDLDALAAMNADPEVMRHFPKCLNRDESAEMMALNKAHMQRHGFAWWALEVPGETSFAGGVSLVMPRFEAHFLPCFEVGWRLPVAFWGKGYASEGAQAVVSFAFDQVGLEEVVSMTVPDNERSGNVMKRLGMTRRQADDFGHPTLPYHHPLRRHVLYRLSRTSWQRSLN